MGLKILIVDDSLTIRIALRRLLGLLDSELVLTEADDGAKGLALMQAQRPDLVLADLNMEPMNGLEMIERMRADASLAQTPVVVISSEGDPEVLAELKKKGVHQSIRKPFDLGMISEVLERELARGQALAR
jgi:CheY-like chemotaxis protein